MAKTILVAEDSASARLTIRMLLQNRHGELVIREALNGADAIEKARKLLDLAMPEQKLCHERRQTKRQPRG